MSGLLNDILNRSFLEKWAEVLVWQLWLVYDELKGFLDKTLFLM